jgi:hypothetical protein
MYIYVYKYLSALLLILASSVGAMPNLSAREASLSTITNIYIYIYTYTYISLYIKKCMFTHIYLKVYISLLHLCLISPAAEEEEKHVYIYI